jgi:DNA mismatch repair protein MutS
MRRALRQQTTAGLVAARDALDPCQEVCALIARAIADPWQGDGRVIQPGYSPELDELTRAAGEARAWIAALEATERQRIGVKSLKVTYNAVFGYAIEITRPNLDRAPPEYQRRQTLAHAERFVTPALLEREKIILRAEERAAELERALLVGVLNEIATAQGAMRGTARALAQVDLWQSLAQVANTRGYVRPTLTDGSVLAITGGRHPVVEATLDGAAFMANDTALAELDEEGASPRIALLTGPNMAGKSTYLRQVALIVLMAQVGSFVPATNATIGLVDRIFTRVGAEDDLAAGLSTFMLEMVETAYILRHATARSLVILDEIGRGTSTNDGMAIARAVIEHIHSSLRARTLFATHYHDLAALAQTLPRVALWRMAVVEDGEAPVFLHRLEPGASHQSYGVFVASAAGLPGAVVQRARELLTEEPVVVREAPVRYHTETPAPEPSVERELSLALAGLNIIAMTPIEALNILFSLQQRALVAVRAERR